MSEEATERTFAVVLLVSLTIKADCDQNAKWKVLEAIRVDTPIGLDICKCNVVHCEELPEVTP